jgi:predicted heme/steroid binding protein
MKEYSEKELAEYNGKNGRPAYVAYDGKVHNVSEGFLWKDGPHQVLHEAGTDLTEAIDKAPHCTRYTWLSQSQKHMQTRISTIMHVTMSLKAYLRLTFCVIRRWFLQV